MRTGGLAGGSTFTVWVPGPSRDATSRAIAITTPAASLGARAATMLGAAREVSAWAGAGGSGGSAIAEAISVAGENLRSRQGPRSLVVLSDMRQHTPSKRDFERRVPAPEAFVQWLKHEHLLADLRGVKVSICGMHHRRGPNAQPFSAQLAAQVAATWHAAFAAMGSAPTPSDGECSDTNGVLTASEEENAP